MANSAQARKRARQANVRRDHNMSQRSELRTAIKNVRKAILAGDKQAAQSIFVQAQTTIDSIADKNIIHKNKAARHKSRLSVRSRRWLQPPEARERKKADLRVGFFYVFFGLVSLRAKLQRPHAVRLRGSGLQSCWMRALPIVIH
jgi:small subunit ribosomal protein S20